MKDLSKKVTEEAIVKTIGEAIGAAIIFAAGAIWGGLKLISNNPALTPFTSLLWILGIGVSIIVAVVVYYQRRKKYTGNDFLLDVTKLMKELDYGKGYEKYDKTSYLPEKLKGKRYLRRR
jgi:hypothetical protein